MKEETYVDRILDYASQNCNKGKETAIICNPVDKEKFTGVEALSFIHVYESPIYKVGYFMMCDKEDIIESLSKINQ